MDFPLQPLLTVLLLGNLLWIWHHSYLQVLEELLKTEKPLKSQSVFAERKSHFQQTVANQT